MAIVVESQVEALYAYSYDAADGRRIAFDAGEKFTLLCKANDDWWHVSRNNDERPMYVPANYVRELNTEEQYNSTGKCEDKLVLRTSRDLSDIGGDNRNSFHEDSNSVFKDSESSKTEECVNTTEKPKSLSPGTRSLAKTLQIRGIPLRGSVSSSSGNERPKSQSLPVGWVATTDEDSGRPYYYNAKTNETSWKPPRASRSVTSHEDNVPLGWHIQCTESSDELNYYNDENDDLWGKSMDENGKVYFYKVNGTETAWELPEIKSSYRQSFEALDVTERRARSPNCSDRKSKSRSLLPMRSPSRNLELTFPPPPDNNEPWTKTIHRTQSCQSEDSLSSETEESWPPPPEEFSSLIQAQTIEKQGQLNRKKIADSGNKKIKRPSWSSTFVVLFSSNLVFYKDQKAALKKPDLQLGKPESSCELRGATLEWAPNSITRKKNAFQICAVSGLQLILQTDNQGVGQDWFDAIANTIKRLNEEDSSVVGTVQGRAGLQRFPSHTREIVQLAVSIKDILQYVEMQLDLENLNKGFNFLGNWESGNSHHNGRCSASSYDSDEDDNTATTSPTVTLSPGGIIRSLSKKRAALDDNKSNIKDKLLKLITRRPTIEELEKKGILIEQTFGCPIQHLCDREKTTVPKFVTSCIQAIENRGLSFDGLYRVCGNVSLVQRIRISVDQEDPIQLGVSPFDDVHALTGSLKLYFRELPEPLIPFDFFSGFVEAIKQSTRNSKLGALKGLVGQLPKVNYETLKQLLGHLTKVMSERESNRMHAQNLAIVWGPNMMRPRYEAANMAMNMVYQNQIIEFLLLEYKEIFK